MTDYSHTVTIKIPAALQAAANSIAAAMDPDSGGARTFVIGYGTDAQTMTHYVAQTPARASFVQVVQGVIAGTVDLHALVAADYPARRPEEIPPTAAECVAFLAGADIRVDEDLSGLLTEWGLVPVEVTI